VGEPPPTSSAPGGQARIELQRPAPDRILVTVEASRPGYVRLLEAWDPGWTATCDGEPLEVLAGNGFLLALPVEAGLQRIDLLYKTPGTTWGALLASLAALGLVTAVWGAAPDAKSFSGSDL
jgi:uncharacterized membrane protein YfhO